VCELVSRRNRIKMVEELLEKLGFHNEQDGFKHPYGEYHNEKGNQKICLKPDGIYGYTVGSAIGGDYMEMHLNFIPDDPEILEYLIRRCFYI
jgi:hypothetical protein